MAEHARNDATTHAARDGEKLWVGRCALVLVILTPIALAVTQGLGHRWEDAGLLIAIAFWITGGLMGLATRSTVAGRIATWFAVGLLGLAVAQAILYGFIAATMAGGPS